MSFERFTVVRVPAPFIDRNDTKNRPALVFSDPVALQLQLIRLRFPKDRWASPQLTEI